MIITCYICHRGYRYASREPATSDDHINVSIDVIIMILGLEYE